MTDEELLASSIDPLELESSESLSQVNPIKQAESVINTTKTEMWSGNLALNIDFGKGWTFRTAGTYNTSNARNYVFYQDGSKGGLPQRPDSLRFDPYDAQCPLDEFQLPDL